MTARKELKTEKFQMLMERSTIEDIDTWRFENRIATRAEAIRLLVRRGMAAITETKEAGAV